MEIIESLDHLSGVRAKLKGTIGLVPTMGYLHTGHLSLVNYARSENDHVIATIFVNPTQFSQNEDLSTYPRDLPCDLDMLESAGVDYVFIPTADMMYPQGFKSYVIVEGLTDILEGAQRVGHFRGVTTIVAKLFNLIRPDIAYFGQKDAQQVIVIRRMVHDLNFPLSIAVCPIVREKDGLAMSSRNVYLNSVERQAATILYRTIQAVGTLYDQGERQPEVLLKVAADLIHSEPLANLNYVAMSDPVNLQDVLEERSHPLLFSLAVQMGKPRLLDNCLLPLSLNTRKGATSYLGKI